MSTDTTKQEFTDATPTPQDAQTNSAEHEPAGVEHDTLADMSDYATKSMDNDIHIKKNHIFLADKDVHDLIKKSIDELLASENQQPQENASSMPTLSLLYLTSATTAANI